MKKQTNRARDVSQLRGSSVHKTEFDKISEVAQPVVPALWRWRQVDQKEFTVILGYGRVLEQPGTH